MKLAGFLYYAASSEWKKVTDTHLSEKSDSTNVLISYKFKL
jgi:hypothetical protein